MPTSLSLELEIPHIRSEAFPWGCPNVEFHASFSLGSCRDVVVLPSVIDLDTLLSPPGEGMRQPFRTAATIDVEVLGNDDGVTFPLGITSIPLPEGHLRQSAIANENEFRVSLVGAAGMRTGTLVGAFRSRGCMVKDLGDGGSIMTSPAPGSVAAESLGKAASEAAGRGIANEVSGEHLRKFEGSCLEKQAIELLDTATKILASSNVHTTCTSPQPCPCGNKRSRASIREDKKHKDNGDASRTQVSEVFSTDDFCDSRHMPQDRVGHARIKPPSEEDRGHLQRLFPTAGFKFEPTTGSMEWQRIASVNVSKVEREGDLQTLKQFLPEIAVGKLDTDDIDANPGLVNAFRLAQLQSQYLLHCQQVLQRECDCLEGAVATMGREVEGNSQGTIAIKNRARLHRKESRKQDKIINGYSALLRKHNPRLASKVCLDEKGRLKVFRVDGEITRRRRNGKRRPRGSSRRPRHGVADDTLKDRKSEDKECSDLDGSRPGPGFSSSNSSDWSEERGRAPRAGNSGPLDKALETAAEAAVERASLSPTCAGDGRSRHRAEGCLAAPIGVGETSQPGRGRSTDAVRVGGKSAEPLLTGGGGGGEWCNRLGSDDREITGKYSPKAPGQEGSGITPPGREARLSASAAEVITGAGSGTEIKLLSDAGVEFTREVSECGLDPGDLLSTRTGPSDSLLNDSREGTIAVGATVGDAELPPPSEDGRGRAGSDSSMSRRVAVNGSGSRVKNAVEQPSVEKDGLRVVARTPRLVTVTVKPKSQPPPSFTASPQEHDATTLPQHGLPRHHQHQQSLSARMSRGESNKSNADNNSFSPRNDVSSRGAPPGPPKPDAADGEGRARESASPALPPDANNEQTPLAGGGPTASVPRSMTRMPSGGSGERDAHVAGPITSAAVADASRLGLEGDGFPDLSDFDVDDISEIDAGGEWAGSEGAWSLSS